MNSTCSMNSEKAMVFFHLTSMPRCIKIGLKGTNFILIYLILFINLVTNVTETF